MDAIDHRKEQILAALGDGYKRLYNRELPPVLNSTEIDSLNIRTRAALDKDANLGTGLLPLAPGRKGRPRKYLLADCVRHLLPTA